MSPPTPGGSACGTRPTGYAYDVDRFSFEFSQPLSWPLAALGVTPWTAHVDVGDDELAVRFGPWSLVTPLPNVEGASITGPYLPFKVLGPHVSLADRGVTFGTSWHRGVCIRFRRPVPGALPVGLLTHPAATVTVADPERLVELLERRPQGAPGDGDELRRVLESVPSAADRLAAVPATAMSTATGTGDAGPTPVATPPSRRTPRATARSARSSSADVSTPGRPAPRRRPRAAAVPEHPTPADMPAHTPTEKVPGVTPPADEGLPGPDSTL